MCKQNVAKKLIQVQFCALIFALLAACGGGSDGAGTDTSSQSAALNVTPVQNTQAATAVLNGSQGSNENLPKFLGKWISDCLPYPLTRNGASTVHRFELASIDLGTHTFTGASDFDEFSDGECKNLIGKTHYDIVATLVATVMAPVDSTIPGYADIYSIKLTSAAGGVSTMSYMVGIQGNGEALRVGEGDRWFVKPSALYRKY